MIRIYMASFVFLSLLGNVALAQNLTLSPYSRYGIGDIFPSTTTRNMAMGDIGMATLNYASINRLNPASYAEILYTTLDLSGFFQYSQLTSTVNAEDQLSAGFQNIGFAFPTNNNLVVTLGFAPYSAVGYDISSTYSVFVDDTTQTGVANYASEGGLNQAFLGLAGTALKNRLKWGLNGYYTFGTIKNTWQSALQGVSLTQYSDIQVSRDAFIAGGGIQAGLIYADTLSGRVPKNPRAKRKPLTLLRVGAAVDYGFDLDADRVTSFTNRFVVDSIGGVQEGKVILPPKYGLGVAITAPGRWEVSGEATWQDWRSFQYFDDDIELNAALRLAAGAEWIPEIAASQYYKRISYRIGGYLDQTYLVAGGEPVGDMGFTFGFGLPASLKGTTLLNRERAYSQINFGFGIGKRGNLKDGQPLEELYYRVRVGITVNERWFRRVRID